ncbi:Equilibrative nucleoside transporter 1 [Bagarius yarrelli]|uniref:Equilibrative nucleoside transporter 1 n=1 Tax=Bagarius yarrelli TaxID=175774 RepID=A0A556TX55_BAGYA|nr:Equilibrative nucleoside transporter 1 [Bagarius yarrelli]
MGTLLPWNFFITAFDYFNERLNTSTSSSSSEFDQTDPYMFNNMCVLLSQLPLLLFTFLNSFLYQHIPEKMRIAGSMVFILLLFLLTATLVKINMEQKLFFSITMATIWFINMFGAVLQGSLFGLVGKFHPKYSSWFMSGQAMSGIFSAVAMLMSKILKSDNESAALGYFITPCAATLLTLCSITVLVIPNDLFTGKMVTIFTPLCCFLVFNVMDWIGRSATSMFQWPKKDSCLFPILVAFRVIFIPALMMCNIPSRTCMTSVFKNEFAYIGIMSLFAVTNGYFACLSMAYAPQLVRSKDAETAGALMTFFLALGLTLGGAFSFVLKNLL